MTFIRHSLATSAVALCVFGSSLFASLVGSRTASADVILTPDEIQQALAHGPWSTAVEPDPSNRVSGNPTAVDLGRRLFSDASLSRDGMLSCATCHRPDQSFAEDLPRSMGRKLLDRNTPALLNLRQHRWFGWGGSSDNLWAQSMLPILHPDEMGHDANSLKTAIINGSHARDYKTLFGDAASQPAQTVLVNVGKTLAAFQETLTTGKTSFDRFRDALEIGDLKTASAYPEPAQRGLKLFLGEARCAFCHSGANFTNGEFHDAGVPYFLGPGEVDGGRHVGLRVLLKSPFSLDGKYNDDPQKSGAWAVRSVIPTHVDFGTFRVPSLRGVAKTAPYMHDGSLPDLTAVITHYNQINIERLHADGEQILRPIGLDDQETKDLVSFLQSLSDD